MNKKHKKRFLKCKIQKEYGLHGLINNKLASKIMKKDKRKMKVKTLSIHKMLRYNISKISQTVDKSL